VCINRTEPPTFSYAVAAHLDGEMIASYVIKRSDEDCFLEFDTLKTSDVTKRNFMFKPMTLTGASLIFTGLNYDAHDYN